MGTSGIRRQIAFFFFALAVTAGARVPAQASEDVSTDTSNGRLLVPWQTLERAVDTGDAGHIGHAASRIGLARFAAFLHDTRTATESPRRLTAILTALVHLPGGQQLLPWLLPLTQVDDPSLAATAVMAVGQAVRNTEGDRHHRWETPRRILRIACTALAAIAHNPGRPIGLRLAAVEAHAGAGTVCAPEGLEVLLQDSDPEIRRAAAFSLGTGQLNGTFPAALLALLDDADPQVAAAATARLCGLSLQNAGTPGAGVLPPAVVSASRRFALITTAASEDVVDMLDCLAQSDDPDDRQLLEKLATDAPVAARTRALELVGAAQTSGVR